MSDTGHHRVGDAYVVFTGRAAGDLGHAGDYVHAVRPEVQARRRAVVDLPWTWLRQAHGEDAAVTDRSGCALAVLTADCAPVALLGSNGVVGVAHAGWRGLVAGVLERAVEVMRAAGAGDVHALLGPCIRPGCYEFGADDLAQVARRLGDGVRGTTSTGAPALDVPAAVRAALGRVGVVDVGDVGICTACSPAHFSHRARRELGRQALVVWRA
ncbi:MAG: polyphenol oxidase family protein [Actinobacteria bacterium]|nr:MAG: polyphenol oxidase family protein [Actinomycetota bacterium]